MSVRRLELFIEEAELVVHAVDVRRERAQLVAILDAHVLSEVTGRDPLDSAANRSERTADGERKREADYDGERDAGRGEAENDRPRLRVGLAAALDAVSDLRLGAGYERVREALDPIRQSDRLRL